MATEPVTDDPLAEYQIVQLGWWLTHPDTAPEPERARFLAAMGPMLQTYPGLTVDAYWQLGIEEWDALFGWLIANGTVKEAAGG